MSLSAAALAASVDPVIRACGADREPWLCRWIAQTTHNTSAARAGAHLSPLVSVLLIALTAWVVNRIARRLIRRASRQWESGGRFSWLRDKRVFALLDKTGPTPDIRRHQRAETIGAGIRSFVSIAIWAIAFIAMLGALGIKATTLLTSAGLIGVALGFGAQNLLRDLIAGTFMIFEDQVGVGDVLDLGLASGTVEAVSLRTTKLRDVEGVVWYVPNGGIARVGNRTQQWSRAVLDVPVAYDADVQRAQDVIRDTATEMAREDAWRAVILSDPEVWGVESLGLDSMTIRLVVKTAPMEQWRVARALRGRLKQALDQAGIASRPAAEPGSAAPPAPPPSDAT
jgi:small conductance mechanosensitive channel